MRYSFTSPTTPRRVLIIPSDDALQVSQASFSGTGPYFIELASAPAAAVIVSGPSMDVSRVTLTQVSEPVPTIQIPIDCPFQPSPPNAPDGPTIFVTAGGRLLITPAMSNQTFDLGGSAVGEVFFQDGVSRVRVTNGTVARVTTTMHSLDPLSPVAVTDIILDNLRFVGGLSTSDGNGMRISRLLMTNCSSVAASSPSALDGFHSCAVWGDPGSTDYIIQDCNLYTRGAEACVRLMDTTRSVVVRCTLETNVTLNPTGPANKHCYRIHGFSTLADNVSRSQHSWISDCTLLNHGMMLATLSDSTPQPAYDTVRDAYIKRVIIHMDPRSPAAAGSFQFPSASPTPSGPKQGAGQLRLLGAHVEDLQVWGTWDAVNAYATTSVQHPELDWHFARNAYTHVS